MAQFSLSIKDQMLKKKMEKRERIVRQAVREQGGAEHVFKGFKNKPTEDGIVAMVMASCFGIEDPLSAGGKDGFGLEYIIDEWNTALRNHKKDGLWHLQDEEDNDCGLQSSQSEIWGNLAFYFKVKAPFMDSIGELDMDSFSSDESGAFYVDNINGGLAIGVSVFSMANISEQPEIQFDPKWNNQRGKDPNKFFAYLVEITTPDELLKDKRDLHAVRQHQRHLATGKVVPVRPHSRHNPIHLRDDVLNTSEVDFLVYRAFDAEGVIRYIGEGKENRPGHVNSGISHNFSINEHFFKRGPMRVEVVKRYLSKAEALAIELFLIKSFPAGQLWNIKDND